MFVCAAYLGCNSGEATPLATAKAKTGGKRSAALQPPRDCDPPPVVSQPDAIAVPQTVFDDWLIELAKSFSGYDKAVALTDLKRANGQVLIHRGDVIQTFAGRELATRADVVAAYTRLVAPTTFEVSLLRTKTIKRRWHKPKHIQEEHVVRIPVGLVHGQEAFHQYAAKLVVGRKGDELQLDRLRFRALRSYDGLTRRSAQWRRNTPRGAGLQIVGVRPEWLYDALGLHENDLLRSVDNVSYGSGGQLVRALFTASLSASPDSVELQLTRNGRPLTRHYRFVGPSYRQPGCR